MRVHLHLDGVSTEQLRVITRECAKNRDDFPTYNHGGVYGAMPWEPLVHADGPESWSVTVPACPMSVALSIMVCLDFEMNRLTLDREVSQ